MDSQNCSLMRISLVVVTINNMYKSTLSIWVLWQHRTLRSMLLDLMFLLYLPEGTDISAKERTFSGNSPDGSLEAFVDQGYEPVSLNSNNYLTSPRLLLLNK